jgi:hypothetical protein
METKKSQRICVIGAGPSGIATAKALLDAGLHDVTVYDRQDEVGGNWLFRAELGHSSVFETTHIISSKSLSQFEDFPFPDDYPDYPGHAQLAAYFQAYAKAFDLYDKIVFQTVVEGCTREEDGRWRVQTSGVGAGVAHFDFLFVCNGHHWDPRMPSYPGSFAGRLVHSHQFKRAEPFRGRRVLVIGGGNSACDVAVETSRVSERTDISMRRGYWITPKFVLGRPTDTVHEWMTVLPTSMRVRLQEWLLRVLYGSPESIGLQKPDHRFCETHPVVNSELPYSIRHGKVVPRPDVERFDGSTVVFVDGSRVEYDDIVCCTGFVISHPFFEHGMVDYSNGDVPLYLQMIHPTHEQLYFIGLFQPLGCIWPLAELQAKLAARRILGLWSPPSDLGAAIRNQMSRPDYRQLETPRHTITVDYHGFRRRLLRELS